MIKKALFHIRQGTLFSSVYKKCTILYYKRTPRRIIGYLRNIYNIYKYGMEAPRFGEIVWVNPKKVTLYLPNKVFGIPKDKVSATVVQSSWPEESTILIKESVYNNRIKACFDHFVNHVPWEDTLFYEHMLKDIGEKEGNEVAVIKRLEKLDIIYEQAKREGSLRIKNIDPENKVVARGEPVIHIGPNGKLYKGNEGWRRFSIACILNIKFPAEVGYVHISAIPHLRDLKNR